MRLRASEAKAIEEQCRSVKCVTPISSTSLSVQSTNETLDGVSVTGMWPAWHKTENRQVIMGRPFSSADIDNARQVCMVNDLAIRDLKLTNDPVGEHLVIGGRRFLIVGVVETITERMTGFNTISAELFIPFPLMEKFQDRDYFMQIVAMANSPDEAEDAKVEITRVMKKSAGLVPMILKHSVCRRLISSSINSRASPAALRRRPLELWRLVCWWAALEL